MTNRNYTQEQEAMTFSVTSEEYDKDFWQVRRTDDTPFYLANITRIAPGKYEYVIYGKTTFDDEGVYSHTVYPKTLQLGRWSLKEITAWVIDDLRLQERI